MSWRSIGAAAVRHGNEAFLILVSIATFLAVWPVGEYAILDDWAFVKSLQHLHFDGKLVVMDWNPMSLTGHLVWGLLFTKTLGFSFLSTKIAVFSAGVLVALIAYWFMRFSGVRPALALIGSLGLLLNPLFLVHIFMYMTDVTGLLWQWLSIWLLTIGIASKSRRQVWLAAGSICWGLAFLTRQHGVVIPLALASYILLCDRSLFAWNVILPAFLPGAWITFNGLTLHAMNQPNNQSFQTSTELVKNFLMSPPWGSLACIFWSYAVYIGLFGLPAVLAVRWNQATRMTRGLTGILIFAVGFGVMYWTHACLNGWYFPYVRNVVTPFGMFQSNEFVVWNRPLMWDREWGMAIGLIGILSFLVWLLLVGSGWITLRESGARSEPHAFSCRFVMLVFGFQLAYVLATSPILFDRHLLLLAPTAVVLVALLVPADISPRISVAAPFLVGYAVYGIICSHDLHSVSRAVFLEGDRLLATGVPADQIDAGYAFDGWYMYEASQQISPAPAVELPAWWPDSSLPQKGFEQPWWIYHLVCTVKPLYVVTASTTISGNMYRGEYHFEEIEGEGRYWTYWPYGEHKVKVFRGKSIR